jgi:hypothetical protein
MKITPIQVRVSNPDPQFRVLWVVRNSNIQILERHWSTIWSRHEIAARARLRATWGDINSLRIIPFSYRLWTDKGCCSDFKLTILSWVITSYNYRLVVIRYRLGPPQLPCWQVIMSYTGVTTYLNSLMCYRQEWHICSQSIKFVWKNSK